MPDAKAQLQNNILTISGDWHCGTGHPDAAEFLKANPMETPWILRAEGLGKWDSSLLVFLSRILAQAECQGKTLEFSGLPDGLARLLRLGAYGRKNATAQKPSEDEVRSLLIQSGLFGLKIHEIVIKIVNFVGEITQAFCRLLTFRSTMRGNDFLLQLQDCGPRALPIVSLISFLMGLILAFIGSIPLKWFQAEPYVASLVGIGMLRLLAPVMVGVVMAGRTSAAYAAELGTMQVNEELDAMHTMGISKIDFLIMPRFLAMTLMLPVLCIFADIVSILGGMVVAVLDMDQTSQGYLNMLYSTTRLSDLYVGIFTCFILGILDACCGCYQGIYCGRSAASVGRVTTAAVVYSIVCIVIAVTIITVITVFLKL